MTNEATPGVDGSAPAAEIVHDRSGTTDEGSWGMSRRRALALAAVAVAVARTGLEFSSPKLSAAGATEIGPQPGSTRADAARQVRVAAADFQRAIPIADHPDNGDEARYPDRSASYTKALLHDGAGNVSTSEYNKLITGLSAGTASGIEALALPGARKLVNPLASLALGLEGADSHAFGIPPAPTFTSDQTAGEMAELYWMALCRDIPFDGYASSATISAAIGDLNGFRDTRIPKDGGTITVRTVFRDRLLDSQSGNYVSQYLLQTVPYGAQRILQATRRPAVRDYLTDPTEFAAIQNGASPTSTASQDYRYIRNGRDLAEFVHSDFPEQACLNAALIIAAQGNQGDAKVSPLINDPHNPYLGYAAQSAFVTFGNEAFFNLVTRVMQLALQAAWYQKWLVHRRLRPEEMGGKIDATLRLGRSFPVNDQLRASLADPARLGRIQAANGGRFLLPAAYPEGSPTHPAYPSGHSTFVAAGVTMIKAFVDGNLVVKDPVRIADPNNGDTLTPISANLTIDGELDKLVSNIGLGRMFAGVHWRSDHWYGVQLGEVVAIRALQDLARTYPESFSGWRLRRFDLSNVLVTATQVTSGSTPGGQPVLTTNTITATSVATLTPIADSYANQGDVGANYGTSWSLASRGEPRAYLACLRFQFPAAPPGQTLQKAMLRISTTTETIAGSTQPHTVSVGGDSWTESTLNWSNRPVTGGYLGTIQAPQVNTRYDTPLNVPTLQQLLGSVGTLAITTNIISDDGLWFWSRHHADESYRPRLTLTFG